MRRSVGHRTLGAAPRGASGAAACRSACRAAIPCALALAAAASARRALSAEAPVLLRDIQRAAGDVRLGESADLGRTMVFVAADGRTGYELWITDGSAEGTRSVAGVGSIPWSWDGTYAGSQPLPAAAVLDGRLVFAGHDPATGIELWRSDGTAAGTGLLADIYPGPRSSEPARMARSGGTVVFVADDGTAGRELWATDGTPEGTRLLRDIRPGPDGVEGKDAWAEDLRAPVEAGGSVWLSADDGANGPELWTSDGTPEGTVLVADLRPGSAGSQPRNLLELDGFLYLEADDGVHGREPWAVRVEPGADREFRRGDADADGRASIADVVRVLDHLFRHGAAPPCPDAADADDDGFLRVTDAVLEAAWLFRGGPAPPSPGPATCGPDPTPDALGCRSFPPCDG